MSNQNPPAVAQPPVKVLPRPPLPSRTPEEQARLDQFHKDLAKGFVEALNKGATAE